MNGKDLLILFAKAWEEKFKKRYTISWAKDTAIAKRILNAHGEADSRRLVALYLADYPSQFARRAGYSFPVFSVILNELNAELARRDASKVKAHGDFEAIAAARAKADSGTDS
jgi:hypothetical protein